WCVAPQPTYKRPAAAGCTRWTAGKARRKSDRSRAPFLPIPGTGSRGHRQCSTTAGRNFVENEAIGGKIRETAAILAQLLKRRPAACLSPAPAPPSHTARASSRHGGGTPR